MNKAAKRKCATAKRTPWSEASVFKLIVIDLIERCTVPNQNITGQPEHSALAKRIALKVSLLQLYNELEAIKTIRAICITFNIISAKSRVRRSPPDADSARVRQCPSKSARKSANFIFRRTRADSASVRPALFASALVRQSLLESGELLNSANVR